MEEGATTQGSAEASRSWKGQETVPLQTSDLPVNNDKNKLCATSSYYLCDDILQQQVRELGLWHKIQNTEVGQGSDDRLEGPAFWISSPGSPTY